MVRLFMKGDVENFLENEFEITIYSSLLINENIDNSLVNHKIMYSA